MALKPTELNKLHKLKQKVRLLDLDIRFLKKCKSHKVFPKFIKINIPIKNKTTERVLYNAKIDWLRLEIKNMYSKQQNLELQAMEQHLLITKSLNKAFYEHFEERYSNILQSIQFKYENKLKTLDKKFQNLQKNNNDITKAANNTNNDLFPNEKLVQNLSSETFSNEEILFLNKGLNFNLETNNDLTSMIVDVESNIQDLNENLKNKVRSDILQTLSKENDCKNYKNSRYIPIIKTLKSKNVFYLKADKSNSIVILDKDEYHRRVNNMLSSGSYVLCEKDPLQKFSTAVTSTLKQCKILISNDTYRKLHVSNPILPRLYCLPKVHKPGDGMRPIVSCINSPSYLLSKWLVEKLQKFESFPSFAIKNRYQLIDKIKDLKLQEDEYLVSFDVVSLYPSVPIPITRYLLRKWLISLKLPTEIINEYVILTNLCMSQNTFEYNNNFYTQTDGTAMGNPLSCFIANIFMSHFETKAKEEMTYFPRTWLRYVDDIFAVFDRKENLNDFVNKLNSIYPSIKFTYEVENDKKISFLDVLILRNNEKLEFDIYRKPTHTNRFITQDSHHPPEQKRSAFNSMIYRLLNTPLSQENYNKEINYIKNVAKYNGYETKIVDNMLTKALKRNEKKKRTKLEPIKVKKKWVSATYTKQYKDVKKTFQKNAELMVSFKAKNKIKNILGNPKTKLENTSKSGIYQIQCDSCEMKYVGQTKRNIKTRFKEHTSHITHNRPEKSAIAKHCLETDHTISINNTKLLKNITKSNELNAWESLFINKMDNLVNNDNGPIQNVTLLNSKFTKL